MEKINIDRKKLVKENEIEIKQDLIVPDTKQDIFQIKDQSFYCYLSKIEVLNGKVKINGNIDSYIAYLSSGETTSVLQTTLNFTDTIEDDLILENMNVKYDTEIQKQEIKVVNERKISISIVLKIAYEIYGIDEVELLDDFSDIEDIQISSQKININSVVGQGVGFASLKEDLKIESTDIVSDIMKVKTEIQNKEVKISHNKVLAKADLFVEIEYLTQDERVGQKQEKLPIMSFIDIPNVGEKNSCTTDYQVRSIILSFNQNEENAITIQMEYEIICKAFENREQTIVSDLYSLKYDLEFDSKEIEITDGTEGNNKTIKVVQNVRKKEELLDNNYSIVVYTVKKNDTLWDVSKKFRIKQENVISSNDLEEPYNLKAGEKLYIVR